METRWLWLLPRFTTAYPTKSPLTTATRNVSEFAWASWEMKWGGYGSLKHSLSRLQIASTSPGPIGLIGSFGIATVVTNLFQPLRLLQARRPRSLGPSPQCKDPGVGQSRSL